MSMSTRAVSIRHRHRYGNRQDASSRRRLLRGFVREGLHAAAMKPIAAGAFESNGVLHNEDADQLDAASSVLLPPAIRTPYLLKEPAAPHIAAALENVTFDIYAHRRLPCASFEASRHRRGGRRRRFSRAADRDAGHRRSRRRAEAAGRAGGRHAPRLHQPCAAHRRSDRRARADARRLGRESRRSGHDASPTKTSPRSASISRANTTRRCSASCRI